MSTLRPHLLLKRQSAAENCVADGATFDQLAERLSAWPRLYFEPDGSFVWADEANGQAFQLDGQIHDGRSGVDSVELKGYAPASVFSALLAALGWSDAAFVVLRLPGGELISRHEAERFLEPITPASAGTASPRATNTTRRNVRNSSSTFEALEDRRPLAIGPGGHDYQLLGPLAGVSWSAAQEQAAALAPLADFGPGQLVSINSEEEQAFLQATFGDALADQQAWIGANDAERAGQWKPADGSPAVWEDPRFFSEPNQLGYVNWAIDEPAAAALELVSAIRTVAVQAGPGEPFFQTTEDFAPFEGDLEVINPAGPGGRATQHSQLANVGRVMGGRADLKGLPRGTAMASYQGTFDLTTEQTLTLRGTLAAFVASNPFELGGHANFEVRLMRLDDEGPPEVVFETMHQMREVGSLLIPLNESLELAPGRYSWYVVGSAEGAPAAGGRTATASWDFSLSLGAPRAAAFAGPAGDWRSLPWEEPLTYFLVEFKPLDGPQGIELAPAAIAEDLPAGAVVGTLTPLGGEAPFTFEMLNSANRFGLFDNEVLLLEGAELDFELEAIHTIRVRVVDAQGRAFDQDLTIQVSDANEPPTSIMLEHASIAENSPVDTVIGLLFAIDPDADDPAKFALTDDADGRFKIVGNELRVARELDFEQGAAFTVRVLATDRGGFELEETFEVSVRNINEAPKLAAPLELQATPGAELSLGQVTLDDPDLVGPEAELAPLRLSVMADHGALWFGDLNELTVVAGENGAPALSIEGPLSALRRALGALVFRAPADYQGVVELTLKVNDLGSVGAGQPQSDLLTRSIQLASPLAAQDDAYQVAAGGRLLAHSYSAAVKESEPLSWWRLDESAGAETAQDAVGGRHGAVGTTIFGGPAAVPREPGKSARFGHGDARIVVAADETVGLSATGFSLEAWIKPGDAIGVQRIFSTRGVETGWSIGLIGQQLVLTHDGEDAISTSKPVRIGDWSHVVVTVDPTGEAAFYMDGELIDRRTVSALALGGEQLALGGHPDAGDEAWSGDLDELAVYARPLSPREVARHYEASRVDQTVLANDGDGQRRLSAELVEAPEHGTVEFLPDGSFVYRPVVGFAGVDSFRYRALDGQIASPPTKVTITVTALPGDADFDGDVDLDDFARLKAHFGSVGATAAEGDFSGDGRIDLNDFALLKSNFGRQAAER
jgi:hypothetical protein